MTLLVSRDALGVLHASHRPCSFSDRPSRTRTEQYVCFGLGWIWLWIRRRPRLLCPPCLLRVRLCPPCLRLCLVLPATVRLWWLLSSTSVGLPRLGRKGLGLARRAPLVAISDTQSH